jgi:DNA-binding transcriptional MerR regulator
MAKELQGKMYYSISEAAKLVGVEPYVMRFWEKEFPQIKPKKNRAGNRTYRPEDIQKVIRIKRLLHDDGYTIDGARKLLKQGGETAGLAPNTDEVKKVLRELRIELEGLIKLFP